MKSSKLFLPIVATFVLGFSSITVAVQPLEITEAFVVNSDNSRELMVIGENFNNGGDVELWLGGHLLTIVSRDDTMIVAELPIIIPDGSYQLVASSGGGSVRYDDFDGVTIGAAGPAGADGADGADGQPGTPGADGSPGVDGADGVDGVNGSTGPDGPEGPTRPAGPDGPTGATGATGLTGATGMTGATGGTGDQGPQGEAGNLLLAGMICPDGEFLRGFDASGNIICSSIIGDTEPPPPPPPPGETNPPGFLRIQPIAICRDDGTQCATIDLD